MIEKTIIIDVDGVLLEEKPTFERSLAHPIKNAVKITKWLKIKGYHVILYTARGHAEYWMTKKQLDDYGFFYNQLLMGKPIGKYYVDDRAISSLDELCKKLEINMENKNDKIM